MNTFDSDVLNLNPREVASFFPVAAEPTGRETHGHPRARRADAADEPRADTFILTERGRAAAELEQPGAVQNEDVGVEQRPSDRDPLAESDDQARQKPLGDAQQTGTATSLSAAEQLEVAELRHTDQKVRAHEQSHVAAGGTNLRYTYRTGPDGRSYAICGTTDIAISAPTSDADGKLAQARKLRSAALAPVDPSAQDLAVMAKAARLEIEARTDKANEAMKEFFQND